MPHLVLLGDSIFDNGAYTDGQPAVIDHVREHLPAEWKATLAAIDGSTTEDIAAQITGRPDDATHLALSVGGNDAVLRADVLDTPMNSSGQALHLLGQAAGAFEISYRQVIDACLATGLPLTVCTVYNGCFPDPGQQQRVTVALTVFNDVILRTAVQHKLTVIELRLVCMELGDYANPIEPSAQGGDKIAQVVVRSVLEPAHESEAARVLAA